jgi:hypothetical protein
LQLCRYTARSALANERGQAMGLGCLS